MTRQCSLWFRFLLPRRDSVPCCRCDCCVVTLAWLPRRQTLGRPVCRRGGVANFRTSVCKCHQSHKRLCWAGTRVFSCTQEPVLLVKLQQFDIVERKYTACNIYSYWLTLHSTIRKPLWKKSNWRPAVSCVLHRGQRSEHHMTLRACVQISASTHVCRACGRDGIYRRKFASKEAPSFCFVKHASQLYPTPPARLTTSR